MASLWELQEEHARMTADRLRAALQDAHDWFESQAKAISKGCGSSWDLMQVREQRDRIAAELAALTPAAGDVSWPQRIDTDTPDDALSAALAGEVPACADYPNCPSLACPTGCAKPVEQMAAEKSASDWRAVADAATTDVANLIKRAEAAEADAARLGVVERALKEAHQTIWMLIYSAGGKLKVTQEAMLKGTEDGRTITRYDNYESGDIEYTVD